jgi:DHA2 family multidrug resistance protein
MGLGMTYSMNLVPNIDYDTLAKMRTAQSFGIALLFVPISTLAYATLPKEMNSDAAALYTMFRNVSGSIGISLATAMVTQRTQVRTAHLVTHLDKFNPNYNDTIARYQQTLMSMGHAAATTMTTATGQVYQVLRTQAQVLAYADVFMFCAIGAFCVVPVAFLFSGVKAKGGGGGH